MFTINIIKNIDTCTYKLIDNYVKYELVIRASLNDWNTTNVVMIKWKLLNNYLIINCIISKCFYLHSQNKPLHLLSSDNKGNKTIH